MVDQCHRLPLQKVSKVENLISSNSGPDSIAIERSWWLLQFTTLTEALWAMALLSTSACVCLRMKLLWYSKVWAGCLKKPSDSDKWVTMLVQLPYKMLSKSLKTVIFFKSQSTFHA